MVSPGRAVPAVESWSVGCAEGTKAAEQLAPRWSSSGRKVERNSGCGFPAL